MYAFWSALSFGALWLLLAAIGVVVALTVVRLERDDGSWRRGL